MSAQGALDGVTSVLGVAGSITTLVSLAALSLLIAYLLAGQWLRGKSSAAQEAIAKSDNAALARLLGGTMVPLDSLSAEQKFALATEELRTRKHQRVIAHSLLFFGFLALLGFAFALAVFSPEKAASPPAPTAAPARFDPLRALEILRLVRPADRAQACLRLMSQSDCTSAAATIQAMDYQDPTPRQDQVLQKALTTGVVSPGQVLELAVCGGSYDFRVENNRLLCADGTPVPYAGAETPRRMLTDRVAIVFHSTGTADVPVAGLARLIVNGRPGLAGPLAHVLISRTGAVVQTAAFNAAAAHVGFSRPWNGVPVLNSNSIGVEMSHDLREDFTSAQLAAANGIARALTRAYGIRAIVGHMEVAMPLGRKADPGPNFPIRAVREAAGLPPE